LGDYVCKFYRLDALPVINTTSKLQGDHLSGKPGNVREFETCQGNVRDVVDSQGNVREEILSWKSVPKLATVYLNI